MGELIGLPGVKGGIRVCEYFRSISGCRRILRDGLAATAAADNGAINVWRDDEGSYRCEAYRYKLTIAAESFSSFAKVADWLKVWLGRIA
jgi:hypothetical protein